MMRKKEKIIPKEEGKKIKEKHLLSQEEVNTLEQMLEKDEEKRDLSEIKEIIKESKIEKSSPSLNKINLPQRIPTRLEANFTDTPTPNNTPGGEEDDSFKYAAGGVKPEGAKYVKYEGKIIDNVISRTEIPNIGKGNIFERRTIGFENSPQAEISEKNNFEKYSPVSKVDKDKLGKEKPFERKEIKYTPEKY